MTPAFRQLWTSARTMSARLEAKRLAPQPHARGDLRVLLTMPSRTVYRSTDRDYVLAHFADISRDHCVSFLQPDSDLYDCFWNLDYVVRRALHTFHVPMPDHVYSPRLVAAERADVVFAYGLYPSGQVPVPVVFEQTFAPASDADAAEWTARVRKACTAAVERAELVVTATPHSALCFEAIFPGHAAKLRVVPYYLPKLAGVGAVARVADGRLRLLFVGKEARRKGLDTFVSAWSLLEPEVRARIDVQVVSSFVDGHVDLPDGWTHMPFVPSVLDAMRSADVLVFPTKLEAYGLVLVEAMACGCAVVTTHAPIQRSIVGDEAGRFVDPSSPYDLASALNAFACDPAELAQRQRAARLRFERQFAPAEVGARYARVLYEAGGRAGSPVARTGRVAGQPR